MDQLLPSKSAPARQLLQAILDATSIMDPGLQQAWTEHVTFLKGDLAGQRGSTAEAMARDLGVHLNGRQPTAQLVMAVESFVVFVANLGALCAVDPEGCRRVESLAQLPDGEFTAHLDAIASGTIFADHGIAYPPHALDFGWWPSMFEGDHLEYARAFLRSLDVLTLHDFLETHKDCFGRLYLAIAPKALLHPTGEHYTPFWLAEELVAASRWTANQRMIDPFGGSGVMLLAALEHAHRAGVDRLTTLQQLSMIELNPATAAIAKANLIKSISDDLDPADGPIDLPVLCADTLEFALTRCSHHQQDMWRDRCRGEADFVSSDQGMPDPVDVILTNPPWVGWEYISRPYREHLEPLWAHYSLFESTGREAAFLKEDLSTLALAVAFDLFLTDGGRASVVLRYASMTSNAASGGLRRLHLKPSDRPLELRKVAIFDELRVFEHAVTKTAVWHLTKGTPTSFPVPVEQWELDGENSKLSGGSTLAEVEERICRHELALRRVDASDPKSRWTIGDPDCLRASKKLEGDNPYRARTGVFTGGANAVYYLEPLDASTDRPGVSWFRNRTERARRKAPQTCTMLEEALVYEIIRGRDVGRWHLRGHEHLLCPHTKETRMRAIPPQTMADTYPLAKSYLEEMRSVLDKRRGFSGWEKAAREEAFYAILRIGDYTFEPYKVAWRYMADDFIVSVIPPTEEGRPRLPNDKVMYIGCADEAEAYYLCGVLSSDPVRWKVLSSSTSTQISASVIEPLGIPPYDASHPDHEKMADACRTGHYFAQSGEIQKTKEALEAVNAQAARLFGLDEAAMAAFADACAPATY
ncbi:SAM-dependent DNA methyltransferase [Persicimonas caeni]|uniref:SAM-dependent DNA methyltransferase n=1 Tax=Persicimonas caeni TaxID=2292766 RepID=A0A4Y6PY95_PERCE|nr:N-6 DNA methylase [Persicimonas caeni]QDG52725.1 SAM-dependent DNA methyltransferase [Persicimonas caeni]QED33947.1 SAM-dependent DNA methyltransferase [Persicimonas caeni]